MGFSPELIQYIPQLKHINNNVQLSMNVMIVLMHMDRKKFKACLSEFTKEEDIVVTILSLFQSVVKQPDIANNETEHVEFNPYIALETKKQSPLQCKTCKSTDVNYILRQTRSADEGMTCLCICQSCRATFVL
jgi:DNA-directed RNA polymerase subunit M/transcription elongation factor TFIIS